MSATMGVSCTGNESAAAAKNTTEVIPKQGGPLLGHVYRSCESFRMQKGYR
jgi:hypothetical protein